MFFFFLVFHSNEEDMKGILGLLRNLEKNDIVTVTFPGNFLYEETVCIEFAKIFSNHIKILSKFHNKISELNLYSTSVYHLTSEKNY